MVALRPITRGLNLKGEPPIRGRFDLSHFPAPANEERRQSARPHVQLDGWFKSDEGEVQEVAGKEWLEQADAVLARAVGDYALLIWHEDTCRLWLARSPLSSRPLFFRRIGQHEVAVSSLASDLVQDSPSLDFDAVAKWYGALVGTSIEPMFEHVESVSPGTIVAFSKSGKVVRRFWDPGQLRADGAADEQQLASNLRTALEQAVGDAMGEGRTATLLSAGRDSGGVSAITARLKQRSGEAIDCFTSSSGQGQPLNEQGWLIDEAEGAAAIADLYPNIRHHLVTPRAVRFCEVIEQVYRVHSAPLGNPLSLSWWTDIQRQAAQAGCQVIMTGGMGNLTISDGGPSFLAELVGKGDWRKWRRAAADAASFPGASWLNILNVSFGGRTPRWAYGLAQRAYGRHLPPFVVRYLSGELKGMVADFHRRQDQRPPANPRRLGQEMLHRMELGDISSDLMFGVSMRDPTADRRVVEAAFAIPPEMLVSRYDRRPMFEGAFGDLLPSDTIRAPRRAYQSMDWNLAYDVRELRAGLTRYSDHSLVRECLDLGAMAGALDRWPTGRLPTLQETGELGEGLLRAFALSAFLWVHFPS